MNKTRALLLLLVCMGVVWWRFSPREAVNVIPETSDHQVDHLKPVPTKSNVLSSNHSVPKAFFERKQVKERPKNPTNEPKQVRWLLDDHGRESWYSEEVFFATPQTNVIRFQEKSVTIVSNKLINTNAVMRTFEEEMILNKQVALRSEQFEKTLAGVMKGSSKQAVLELVGESPVKSDKNERFNYLVFSTHPDRLMPRGLIENWPLVYVFFDSQDQFVRWDLVKKQRTGFSK